MSADRNSRGDWRAAAASPTRPRRWPASDPEGTAVDPLRQLCHDLRHPAAAIDALVAAVQVECELPPEARARLDQIATEARRIAELCGRVLRPGEADVELLRVDQVALEVADSARAAHPDLTVAASPASALVDAVDLRRIVWNLLDNAVRAAGPGGQVLLAVRSTGDEVRLEVGDSGPGFGAGSPGVDALGLSIVRALAERHGGRVEGATSELGGAQVSVVLPPAHIDNLGTGRHRTSAPGGPGRS